MKRLLLIALVVALAAASWILYSQEHDKVAPLPEGIITEAVTRGTIESLISATGSVAAEYEQQLTFAAAGQVVEVLVEEGDRVIAGQTLARLDDQDLLIAVRQAEAALAVTEAQLAQTRVGPTAEEIARYEAAVEIAQASSASARAGVASAQANIDRVLAGATDEEISIAERRVEEAKNRLWGTQSQRDAICGRLEFGGMEADCDNAEASVNQAEEAVRIAELQLQSTLKGARPEELTTARAQLDQARAQLAQTVSQVSQAEADLARALRGASPEQVAVAEAQVEQSQIGVLSAELRLADVELKAPNSGVLAWWSLRAGDQVSPGTPVGTLVDDERYHLLVDIDETDIGQVCKGQEARLSLDAYPEVNLAGRVTSVSLLGEAVQGLVTYRVRVDLEPTDVAVRPLMTATVDIVVDRQEEALRIPTRALRRDAKGRYVDAVRSNRIERVDVEIGVSDSVYTEVVQGLAEGDQVVVSQPRTDLFGGLAGGN
ncbi:MAG: efflux RND transporter periplasmic adaptor subunit [Chloroflexi bacterium]|jgi:HlyD family secretion protein|nr:efflux RND transporter periplasmic adaptor subunit [Chloroflexota bacterium]